MKSFEIDFKGNPTLVYFADDVDKNLSELREQHKKELRELEDHWRATLYSREREVVMEVRKQEERNRKRLERLGPRPRNFFEDVCNVIQTCDKEGNTAPAYDFLRGLVAGWWLCDKINSSPQESVEDQMRKWMNKPKEEK